MWIKYILLGWKAYFLPLKLKQHVFKVCIYIYIYISLGVGKKEELEQIWRFYDQIGSTMLWKLPVMMSHPTTKNDVQLFFFFFLIGYKWCSTSMKVHIK